MKEAKVQHVSGRVDVGQLESELCSWSVRCWQFVSKDVSGEGGLSPNIVVSNSDSAFWLGGRLVIVQTPRTRQEAPAINYFPLIIPGNGGSGERMSAPTFLFHLSRFFSNFSLIPSP